MATGAEIRQPLGAALPDRYELLRRMAAGGMATVWCGRDRLLGRTVAIKLIAEQLAADETAVRRLEREARAAARLSGHPNVVTIYDVGHTSPTVEAPSRPFIVMERLRGGTVADALRAAPVGPRRAVKWLREAAAAIDFAHGHGVIHRDIKPSNFLLDDARVLHVADFGIALVATEDTLTFSGQLLGTAAYLAPEIALGQPATEASDRYALAVAAFELLTGERPFTAPHFAAQARHHIETPPPRASARNPRLPKAVDEVLAQGMAKRPQARFATAAEFVAAIEERLSPNPETPTAVTAPIARPPVREYTRANRRRPHGAAVAALAAVLIVLVIAALSAAGGGPRGKRAVSGTGVSAKPAVSLSGASAKPAATAAIGGPESADTLEARGHQLMLAGDYQSAIPVLRQAVAAAPHSSLTYAYALYDLGRSLRLSGDPQAAVPVLEQRLQIPNQTAVVRSELALALQQAVQGPGQAGRPGPAGDHANKHAAGGKHGHGEGGD